MTRITVPGLISLLEATILAIIVEPPALEFPFITSASQHQ